MKRGDVVELGSHRLMCGDCTSQEDVGRLFGEDQASTIIFSPPYKNRRVYDDHKKTDSGSLFLSAINVPPKVADVQVFAVVGNLHERGEQDLYYEEWLSEARRSGWKRFFTYIWDKGHGLPGRWNGRLAPCFEWIFHLNKKPREPIKHVATIWGKGRHQRRSRYSKAFTMAKKKDIEGTTSDFKIDNAIIRVNPSGRSQGIGHPDVYPVLLPQKLLLSYAKKEEVVFDPMAGSGSTMLAAEALGIRSFNCELSPAYCDMAVERYQRQREKNKKN